MRRRMDGAGDRRAGSRAGWSLPITWIAPLGIGGLVYLFGWQALAYVLAAVVVIVVGPLLRDARTPRTTASPPGRARRRTAFRFQSQLELSRLGDLIEAAFATGAASVEREGVWEWLACESSDGELSFNLSRKRRTATSEPLEPCRLLVTYRDEDPRPEICDRLARELARALGEDLAQIPADDPYWDGEADDAGAPSRERVFRP